MVSDSGPDLLERGGLPLVGDSGEAPWPSPVLAT
jgi:hypothetical protein